MPIDPNAKIQWLKDMVCKVLNQIDPQSTGKILFISPGRHEGRAIPMVEVKIDSFEAAIRVRKMFAQKKKDKIDLGRLHVANSVTLATRVRADILKAIAKQQTKPGFFELFVSAYSSRPVLYVHEKQNNNRSYTLTFTDAVARFGRDLKEDDLLGAYRRAGNSFPGQLEQHFVVLENDAGKQSHYQGGSQLGGRWNGAAGGVSRGVSGGRGRGSGQGRGRGSYGSAGGAGARGGFNSLGVDPGQGQARSWRGRGQHNSGQHGLKRPYADETMNGNWASVVGSGSSSGSRSVSGSGGGSGQQGGPRSDNTKLQKNK